MDEEQSELRSIFWGMYAYFVSSTAKHIVEQCNMIFHQNFTTLNPTPDVLRLG